jgi:hypothetical protein
LYAAYYNFVRTHRSLDKDALVSRPVQRTGVISSRAILGGLHHRGWLVRDHWSYARRSHPFGHQLGDRSIGHLSAEIDLAGYVCGANNDRQRSVLVGIVELLNDP